MSYQKGKLHPKWKGKDASYSAVHHWIKRELGSPLHCSQCNKTEGTTRNFHWANISGKYKRELTDWKRLCVSCHVYFDNRNILCIKNLPKPKLSDTQVHTIRGLKNLTQRKLAEMFNVNQSQISRILNYERRS